MAENARVEAFTQTTKRKMEQATALIGGLRGAASWNVNSIWGGGCALAAAFLSYCGPFNREYRHLLLRERLPYELGAVPSPPSTSNVNATSTKPPFPIPLTRSLALEESWQTLARLATGSCKGLRLTLFRFKMDC
jgi:hypothetical protein